MRDRHESSISTRREFLAATLISAAAALVLGILWLLSRGAPSATRDPFMRQPSLVSIPTPTPQLVATPAATPRSQARRTRRRRGDSPYPDTSGAGSP